MKKLFKMIICVLLIATFSFSAVGCSGGGEDETGAIVVKVFDGGYNVSWLDKIIKAFEDDTGINVVRRPEVTDTGSWVSEIQSGTTNVDIFFDCNSGLEFTMNSVVANGTTYQGMLADLTDMYNTKVPGEDILYKDKMIPAVREAYNFDYKYNPDTHEYYEESTTGKYYTTSWANSALSFVVNMGSWDSSWGEFPNTTDEMFVWCEKVIASNEGKGFGSRIYPFAYSLKNSYWDFVYTTWAYQYMGETEYNDYMNGYDKDGNRFTPELLLYDGFEKSLEVLQGCLLYRGTDGIDSYSHPYSLTIDFTTSQFYLLNGSAIAQPNGNWLISEMVANYSNAADLDIQFKKIPVISSIKDRCETIADDAELSALIKSIDSGSSALSGEGYDVSQEDYDRVYFARRYCETIGTGHGAYIPVYSDMTSEAKQFLLYMAKNSSLEIYYKETLGSSLPFNYDYSNSAFKSSKLIESEKTLIKSLDIKPYSIGTSKYRFFAKTGFNCFDMPYHINNSTETYLSAKNTKDRKDANAIFMANYKYARDNWNAMYAAYSWAD